jgi:hypothetical protein
MIDDWTTIAVVQSKRSQRRLVQPWAIKQSHVLCLTKKKCTCNNRQEKKNNMAEEGKGLRIFAIVVIVGLIGGGLALIIFGSKNKNERGESEPQGGMISGGAFLLIIGVIAAVLLWMKRWAARK